MAEEVLFVEGGRRGRRERMRSATAAFTPIFANTRTRALRRQSKKKLGLDERLAKLFVFVFKSYRGRVGGGGVGRERRDGLVGAWTEKLKTAQSPSEHT